MWPGIVRECLQITTIRLMSLKCPGCLYLLSETQCQSAGGREAEVYIAVMAVWRLTGHGSPRPCQPPANKRPAATIWEHEIDLYFVVSLRY